MPAGCIEGGALMDSSRRCADRAHRIRTLKILGFFLLITAVLAPPLARGRAEQQVNKGSSQNSIIAGLREVEGPFNQINTIMVENGRVVSRSVALLPKEAFFYVRPKHELPVVTVAAQPQDKIHALTAK